MHCHHEAGAYFEKGGARWQSKNARLEDRNRELQAMLDRARIHTDAAQARASTALGPAAMSTAGPVDRASLPSSVPNRSSYMAPLTVENMFHPGAGAGGAGSSGSSGVALGGGWQQAAGVGDMASQVASMQEQLEALAHEVLRWKSAAQVCCMAACIYGCCCWLAWPQQLDGALD